MWGMITAGVAMFFIWICFSSVHSEGWRCFWVLVFISMAALFVSSCRDTQAYADYRQSEARDAEEKAMRRRAVETPHVVREADGCKVYAFESGGHTHYFTRCPGETTQTDTTRVIHSGKTSKTVIESVVTESK